MSRTTELKISTKLALTTSALLLALSSCTGSGGGSISGGTSSDGSAAGGLLQLAVSTINSTSSTGWRIDGSGNVGLTTNAVSISGTCSRGVGYVRSKSWVGSTEPSTYDAEMGQCGSNGSWTWNKTLTANSVETGEAWTIKFFPATTSDDSTIFADVSISQKLLVDMNAPSDPVLAVSSPVRESSAANYASPVDCLDLSGSYVCRAQYFEINGTWNTGSDSSEIVVSSPGTFTVTYPSATTFRIRGTLQVGSNTISYFSKDVAGNASATINTVITYATLLEATGLLASNALGTSGPSSIGTPNCSGSNCSSPADVSALFVGIVGGMSNGTNGITGEVNFAPAMMTENQ